MTDKQTPPDWVLIEAAKRSNDFNENDDLEITIEYYGKSSIFRALCDMIEKHEQPPVDRKLLCAREAYDTVLVERLRAMAETCCAGGCDACEAEAKAADRIETLQAIEEAQNENVASLLDHIEALTAENERLREALEEWVFRYAWKAEGMNTEQARIHAKAFMARAALGDTQ